MHQKFKLFKRIFIFKTKQYNPAKLIFTQLLTTYIFTNNRYGLKTKVDGLTNSTPPVAHHTRNFYKRSKVVADPNLTTFHNNSHLIMGHKKTL